MKTILVVEDEWAIADWLQALLGDEGYAVTVASNGRQALEILRGGGIDLVITDFMMPIMDGPALMQALQAESSLAALPVIVMSSLHDGVVRERMKGYRRFLRKPFREGELLAALREVLP